MNSLTGPSRPAPVGCLPTEPEFTALSRAFFATGGLARGTTLARELEERLSGDYISLARHLATDHCFSFRWKQDAWLPMFQFDPIDLTLKPAVRHVLAEMAGTFDGWTLATWFAHPNTWLRGRSPVEVIDSDLAAVLGAARGDRYVAIG